MAKSAEANRPGKDWVWGKVAEEASAVTGYDLPSIQQFKMMPTETARRLIEEGQQAQTQARQARDVGAAIRRKIDSDVAITKIWHGLVRHGMEALGIKRKEDAQTAIEYAEMLSESHVLGHQTGLKSVEIAQRGANDISILDAKHRNALEAGNHRVATFVGTAQQELAETKNRITTQAQARLAQSRNQEAKPWMPR